MATSCGDAYADRRRQLLAVRDDDRIAEGIVRRIDLLLLSEDPRGDVRRLVGHEQRVLDGGGDRDAVAQQVGRREQRPCQTRQQAASQLRE